MIRRTLLAVAVLSLCASTAFAADDLSSVKADVVKILKDITVDSIKTTPIEGLYAIQSRYDLIYFYPKTQTFVVGALHSPDGKSITAASRKKIVEQAVAALDLGRAIKSGSGKTAVIEFLDPQCPHCRQLFEYLSLKENITRYIFLIPNAAQPKSASLAEWILSRQDQFAALGDTVTGKYDEALPAGTTEDGKKLLKEHILNGEKAYIAGTPVVIINNQVYAGADFAEIEAALGEGVAK